MKNCRIISCIMILISVSFFDTYAQPQQKKPKIAVLDFVNVSGRLEYNYLRQTISENIITTFAMSPNIALVERSRLIAALSELNLGLIGLLDESTAAKVGHALGADGIIVGSFTILGNQFRINSRLIDVQTIEVKFAKQVTGTNITSLVDGMSDLLLIEITPDEMEKAELLNKINLRIKQFETRLKSPGVAAIGALILPVAGHSYVGGDANFLRGLLYTGSGTTLIIMGMLWGTDDGLIFVPIGAGIHLVSAIDAGISANRHNKKIRTGSFKLSLNPNLKNRSYSLALIYRF